MIGVTELTNHMNTSPLLRAHFLRVPSFRSSSCGAFTIYYYRDAGFLLRAAGGSIRNTLIVWLGTAVTCIYEQISSRRQVRWTRGSLM